MYLYFIQFACFRQIAKIMSIMPLIMKPMLSGVEMTSITNGKSSGAGSLLMINAIRPATNPTRRKMRPVRNVLSINIRNPPFTIRCVRSLRYLPLLHCCGKGTPSNVKHWAVRNCRSLLSCIKQSNNL